MHWPRFAVRVTFQMPSANIRRKSIGVVGRPGAVVAYFGQTRGPVAESGRRGE